MEREVISIKRKALRVNLEPSIYGTFAEIGAGQEVARTFFQVGGASGTVAKTMSAYDMSFSDAIYGGEETGRYVSESRLTKMLDHEYDLLQQRLTGEQYDERRFFAFADTSSTLNFLKNNDPHSWMGMRFQTTPDGPINEVVLHIRLKENDGLLQQKTLGGIGVNLIFACYWYANDLNAFVDSLMDNITREQAEIDMVRIKGDDFTIDNRLLALMLVKKGFTSGTIFGPDKEVYQPKDVLYKKNILCLRGRFRPVTKVSEDMFVSGLETFKKVIGNDLENLVAISEITLNNLATDGDFGDKDFLDRTEILCSLGHTVMISNCQKHNMLVQYLDRCKPKSIGIVLGMMNMIELFNEDRYQDPNAEILKYFGDIFASNTKMLVYPFQPSPEQEIITTKNFKVSPNLNFLLSYLVQSGFIIDMEGYDKDLLQIFSNDVIQKIKSGQDGWEQYVPDIVAQFIKDNCLFDYPCAIKS
jgi:hypothetical protein